jgi:hypothetical protein
VADLCQLQDVKDFLNLKGNGDDAVVGRLITAQSRFFETSTGRTIARATYTDTFDGNADQVRQRPAVNLWSPVLYLVGGRGFAVTLRNDPVLSVAQVLVDGQVVPPRPAFAPGDPGNAAGNDGWVLIDGARVELQGGAYAFTAGVGNVSITYDAGFDMVPAEVADAVILLVAWRFRERDRLGQTSKTIGGETVGYSREPIPLYAQKVIDLYRKVRV